MTTFRDLLVSQQREYFTDRDEIIGIFRKLILTPSNLRVYRVLDLYGPGGIGKSMVLRELRDICHVENVPNAVVSMDHCNSPIEVMVTLRSGWESGPDSRSFREFDNWLHKYQDLQRKLQIENTDSGKVSQVLGEIVGDVSAAALGGAATSLVLGPIGILLGAAGGAFAKNVLEASVTTLLKNNLISGKDAAFLENLLPNLLTAFMVALEQLADYSQSVLIAFDAFEHVDKARFLSDWLKAQFLPRLPHHTFVVVAGRNRQSANFWKEYATFVYPHRLQPFTESDLAKYLDLRGIDSTNSDNVLQVTAGIPLGAALWADIEIQRQEGLAKPAAAPSFQEVIQVVVERLLEQLDETGKQAVRFASIPRYFDEHILGLLLAREDTTYVYEQLRRYSSMLRSSPRGGLAMHEEVRRHLLDDFRNRNSALYCELNVRMARYYGQKAQSQPFYSDLWFEYRIEHAYHLLAAADSESYALLNNIIDDAHEMQDASVIENLLKIVADLPQEQMERWNAYFVAEIHYLRHDYPQAKTLLMQAAKLPFPELVAARIMIALCHTLWNLGDYEAGAICGEKASHLCDAIHDDRGQIWLSNGLGWIYHDQGNYAAAIAVREKGLNLALKLHYRPDLAWAYNGLGTTHLFLGRLRQAEELLHKALAIWQELNHSVGQFFTTMHIGQLHKEFGDYDSAQMYYNAAIQHWPDSDEMTQVLQCIGETKILQGNFTDAIFVLKKSRSLAEINQKPVYAAWADATLGDAYCGIYDFDSAVEHYNLALAVGKRLVSTEVWAYALSGILRVECQRNAPLQVIIDAASAAEAISHRYTYRKLLAATLARRAMANARHLLHSAKADGEREVVLEQVSQVFIQSMTEAIKHNSYVLDQTVSEFYRELSRVDSAAAVDVADLLVRIWGSRQFEDRTMPELETSQRQRDASPAFQVPISVQLRNRQFNW